MERFFASPSGGSDEPWFRVGTFDVTTTVLVCGLAVVSMVVWAIDSSLVAILDLDSSKISSGQVWRLITWPIVNTPSFGAVLGIVMMYLFGREVERGLGRSRFLVFLATLVLVPAVVGFALDVIGFGGLFLVETAMFLAFIATYPTAMGFFGIPLWVFGAVFIGIQVLQLTGVRAWEWLAVLFVDIAVALLGARAFGLSSLSWIPKLPLPASLAGAGARGPRRRTRRRRGPAPVTPIRPTGTTATPSAADLLRQAEIDVLLDKISEHGIDSLTAAERRRLDELSKHLRDNRG